METSVLRRNRMSCRACGVSARPTLAIHHIIPVALGGRYRAANLTTLCANCHRMVHWLSAGDRSVDPHAYGLGKSPLQRQRLLELTRRIRRRRLRVVGPDLRLTSSVPLRTALGAVVQHFDGPRSRDFGEKSLYDSHRWKRPKSGLNRQPSGNEAAFLW